MLFETPELDDADDEVIDRVLELRKRLKYSLARRRRWVGLLRRVSFARAIQSSNSIEGYNVSLEDAVAAADREEPIDASPQGENWQAVTGYRDAMTYILQLAEDPHFEYSPALLRSLHFMMIKHDLDKGPGRWRPGPIYVHNESTSEVVYEGPPFDEVPALVDALVERLNQEDDHPALARAAMAHLNLVMIHPFRDGNGRMARALQSLVLAREGILAPEFCSIEEHLGRYTQAYYDVLAEVGAGAWNPDRDAHPWLRFCLAAHYRQAHRLLRRTVEAETTWGAVEELVARRGAPDRSVGPLYLAGKGMRLRNETYRSIAETSSGIASRDLKTLVDVGLLTAHGEKRGRSYSATPELRDLTESARSRVRIEEDVDPYAQPALSG